MLDIEDAKKKLEELYDSQIKLVRLVNEFVESEEFEHFRKLVDHDSMGIWIEKLTQSDIGKKLHTALSNFVACNALMGVVVQECALRLILHSLENKSVYLLLDTIIANSEREEEGFIETITMKLKEISAVITNSILEELNKLKPEMNGNIPVRETIH